MSLLRQVIKKSETLFFSRNWNIYHRKGLASASHKLDLPIPPKRPLTAYMLFCKENRKELLKQNPTLSSTEQIKILAEKWNKLPIESKKPFEELARQITVVYGEEHKKFYESLSEDQKELIAKRKAEKRESRRLFKLKKSLHESGLPKPAPSAYALFVQSCAKNKGDIKQLGDFIKDVAEKWKSLPEETKKTFEKQSVTEKARYHSEMEQWKKRLLKEGNDLLLKQYEELKPKAKHLSEESPKLKTQRESKEKSTKKTEPHTKS